MFFRNKKNNQESRIRQPNTRGDMPAARPVFSYHASTARTDKDGSRMAGARRSGGASWDGANNSDEHRSSRSYKQYVRHLAVCIVVGAALVAVIANVIVVREPEVVPLADSGNRQIFLRDPETYRRAARQIIGSSAANTNKLTINSRQIARDMQQKFPELESVSVALPVFGRTPVLYIQPGRPALLLKSTDGSVYIVDTAGQALMNASQVANVQKLGLVLVEDRSGLQTALGKHVLPSGDVAFITEVVGQLNAKKIAVSNVTLPESTNELDVRIEGKSYIAKFNLRGDARAEAGAFLAVKQQLERENKTPGSYIDVRVENKAYYK